MASASNYLELSLGTHLLRTDSFTKPTAIYVALYTTLPADDGTGGVEVSGGSYARVQHGPSNATWAAPIDGNGIFYNIGTIQFPSPTADWGDIVGFGLLSAITGGEFYIIKALTNNVTVLSGGAAPAFPEGSLKVTVS